MKVLHIVGARPNFMKTAPVMRAMARRPRSFRQVLVHTGQHYDYEMSDIFFRHLGMPRPDIVLGVGSGSHTEQVAKAMTGVEKALLKHKPDWVVVVGDVNSTLAGALAAVKAGVKVAHVEAGLRSFDRSMPEEWNRLVTDSIATLLLTPSADADRNLRREGIPARRIRRVGNVMIDSLEKLLPIALKRRPAAAAASGVFALVTLHRPANVDDPRRLRMLVRALGEISKEMPVIFPAHPRARAGLEAIRATFPRGLHLLPPLGYLDFLALEARARIVVTDSGGMQEETAHLGIPCLTVRPNTERPVTVERGTNRLVEPEGLAGAVREALGRPRSAWKKKRIPLWDGHAAERVADALLEAGKRLRIES